MMGSNNDGRQVPTQQCLWPPDELPPLGKRAEERAKNRADERGAALEAKGILLDHNQRSTVRGRALTLIAWMVEHQGRINEVATSAGQLWLTWKDKSITGDIKAPL